MDPFHTSTDGGDNTGRMDPAREQGYVETCLELNPRPIEQRPPLAGTHLRISPPALAPRLRPHRGSLAVAGVFMLVSIAVGLAFPQVVRQLLDAAFLAGDGRLLNRIALGLLALFVVQGFINFGQSYLAASVAERVVAKLRIDLFDSLVHQSPSFFTSHRVGELTSRIASDASLLHGVLRFGIPELIRQGVYLVGALILVTVTNPRLALVTLTAIPFAAAVGWFFGRRVRHLSTGIQDLLAGAVARAEQVFTQIRTVQSFNREIFEAEGFAGVVLQTRDEGLRRAVARASLTGVVTFSAFAAIVLVPLGRRAPGSFRSALSWHPGGVPVVCRDHCGGDYLTGGLLE